MTDSKRTVAARRRRTPLLMLGLAGVHLSGCVSVAPRPYTLADTQESRAVSHDDRAPSAATTLSPGYKIGAPYKANGRWYRPSVQPRYDETGLASWYGDAFDGRPTAIGEIFQMESRSAAHATLPLPSIVEVTNLDNGRTLRVRINDRGPFHPGRIIDLSKGAAKDLGFFEKGTARVRVRYIGPAPLGDPSLTVAAASARRPSHTSPPLLERVSDRRIGASDDLDADAAAYAATPSRRPNPEGAYAVQIAAFTNRRAAERSARSAPRALHPAIRREIRGGRVIYKVTVGQYGSLDAAGRARKDVAALGFGDAAVTPLS